MADSARKNRRSKVDVIVLDDDEPQEKSPRKEPELVPSTEVTELQQKLAKAEKRIERLIKIAGDAQSKVEFLESLIDKKPNIKKEPKNVEDLEKSVADLTNKIEEEREKSRESLKCLTNQLEQERRQASVERAKERERVRTVMDKLEKHRKQVNNERIRTVEAEFCLRIENLGRKLAILEKERVQIEIDRKGDRQRIEELKSKLEKYEGALDDPQPQQLPQPPPMPELQLQQDSVEKPAPCKKIPKINDFVHPTNILHLCRPIKPWALPLDYAVIKLQRSYDSCDVGEFIKFCNIAPSKKFDCEVCDETICNFSIVKHFLSKSHIDKVRVTGAGVSKVAVEYWAAVLQQSIPAATT